MKHKTIIVLALILVFFIIDTNQVVANNKLYIDNYHCIDPSPSYHYDFINMWMFYGYTIEYGDTPLDAVNLDDFDTLMIMVPTSYGGKSVYFTANEQTEISDFLFGGGNLFLVAEYRFDAESTLSANSISSDFGIVFKSTSICYGDLMDMHITNFTSHPITEGLSSIVLYDCVSPIEITSQEAIPLAFFPQAYGEEVVMAVSSYGEGKIFCIGDFEGFSDLVSDDNRKFVGNIIEWFSSEEDTTTTSTVSSTTTTTPPTTTTTTPSGGCTSGLIYGDDSGEAELLRYIRDNVLSKTPEGRELIRLYYQWSPLIVKAMKEDEEFKEEMKEMIDGVLGLVEEEVE